MENTHDAAGGSEMNHDTSTCASEWDVCPVGSLREMGKKLRSAKRHKAIRRHATSVTAALVLFACAWHAVGPASDDRPSQDITCAEVQSQLPHYAAGQLADSARAQITAHMRTCPGCAAKFREMSKDSPIELSTADFLAQALTSQGVQAVSYAPQCTQTPELPGTIMLAVR
jgi:hypothetical protein